MTQAVSIGDRTVQELGAQISQPNVHVGGGAAAAASASLAAASAELVNSLSLRRARSPEVKAILQQFLDQLAQVRLRLLTAADNDEAALVQLMSFYRSKEGDERELLTSAADTVIEIARLSSNVVEFAAKSAPYATRFTVSDIGAAAAIAHGAVTAALLTAEINVQLLDELDGQSGSELEGFRSSMEEVERQSEISAREALASTRERVTSATRKTI